MLRTCETERLSRAPTAHAAAPQAARGFAPKGMPEQACRTHEALRSRRSNPRTEETNCPCVKRSVYCRPTKDLELIVRASKFRPSKFPRNPVSAGFGLFRKDRSWH